MDRLAGLGAGRGRGRLAAQVAADFVRRWDEEELVTARRLVAQFDDGEQLRDAFQWFVSSNSVDAYVLYRELDYFEQLGALEELGAVPFDLAENEADKLTLPALPAGMKTVDLVVSYRRGGGSGSLTLPVEGG